MDALPSELILHIISLLDPLEIVNLQLVSRRFFLTARDSKLWRTQCFETSSWEKLRLQRASIQQPWVRGLQEAHNRGPARVPVHTGAAAPSLQVKTTERSRILANWDPSYPGEQVDWYAEYIQRLSPVTVSWLEQPRNRDDVHLGPMDVRGVGTYNPLGDRKTTMVLGPLDDGSVCLWDLTGSSDSYGRIINRSTPGTLFPSGSGSGTAQSKMINTGVTECVTIDADHDRAYIAVQSDLIGVDLATLKVVSREKFPFSISAISEARPTVPITVGTNLSLHMYDPRTSLSHLSSTNLTERLEEPRLPEEDPAYRCLYNLHPLNYAPLIRPPPLCIVHMPTSGSVLDNNGEIFVAGRFASILQYDRRTFPRIKNDIYSGSRLCGMTSIPFPFTARFNGSVRRGELSVEQVNVAKQSSGNTLIACGEYNSKGSLELYGLRPDPLSQKIDLEYSSIKPQSEEWLKNRQTSSNSKLLSVANHGTQIVFSDGGGNIKWIERDGFTAVRELNIGSEPSDGPHGIFGSRSDSYAEPGSGEIVRKIIPIKPIASRVQHPDDLVLWTGDKLGLLSFTNKPRFVAESLETRAQNVEELMKEREERAYEENMKRALMRQADEVRFVRGLGLGLDLE